MLQLNITKQSTMREIIEAYPNAQRALFQRYHIGGCNSCGYQPEDVIGAVAQNHKIQDIDGIIAFIQQSDFANIQEIETTPQAVNEALKSNSPPYLIDVRTTGEWNLAKIENAQLNNKELAAEIMKWPKDTAIVFFCHHGQRSLDAASYFSGHRFTNVKSMAGGIDAWSLSVDPSVPRYEIEQKASQGGIEILPLRSVVSQEAGCRK